jgi:hypothetical protein
MTAQHIIEAISYGRILAEFNAHSKALFMVAITKKWVGDTERSAIKHFERIRELAHLLEGKLDIAEELSECWLDYQYILADPTKPVSSLSFRLGREIRYREHTKEAI